MSKRETPMTVAYWQEVGGTLVEEFRAVRRGRDQAQRLLDAIILPHAPRTRIRSHQKRTIDVRGQDVIVVQTKAIRLGMYLLGQAYFSGKLVERMGARSVRTVALCAKGDAVMEELAREAGIEVIVRAPDGS